MHSAMQKEINSIHDCLTGAVAAVAATSALRKIQNETCFKPKPIKMHNAEAVMVVVVIGSIFFYFLFLLIML